MDKGKILESLKKLKQSKRKFVQSIDLVVTLKGINPQKETVDIYVSLPHIVKQKKVCLFAEKATPEIEKIFAKVVSKETFADYDKKASKKLAKEFDFFVSQASLMATVASAFGRVLGPAGKMPSPSTGSIVPVLNEKQLKELVARLGKSARMKTAKKDSSLKVSVGKQDYPEEEIYENILAVEEALIKNLPKGKENMKNILIKTTMSKPIKLN